MERAFEIAPIGSFREVEHLRRKVLREAFHRRQIERKSLRKQLMGEAHEALATARVKHEASGQLPQLKVYRSRREP